MNGIVINIDPVIFQLGAFEIRWYSLAVALGAVTAVLILVHRARKKGIEAAEIYSLALWVMIAGLVGARLFHVIDHFEYYAANPLQVWQIQQGGLAIWGAMVGGGVATVIYARIRRIPLGRLADAAAPAMLAAFIIGRLGCIVNGDAYGGVTELPWGFIYSHPDASIPSSLAGLPTHPYPVYEMVWNAVTILGIWRLGRYFKRDGLLFLSGLSLYSLGRFVLTFVRQENIIFWGLQQAQLIALVILIASAAGFVYLSRKATKRRFSKEGI